MATTLVTVIKADGAVKFVKRDGRLTADTERSIEASARKLGAEVAGFRIVPERTVTPQTAIVKSVSEAVQHPESLTDTQVFEVHAVLSMRYFQARGKMLSARTFRPSYAPKGRETASERGTAAVLADTGRSLAVIEAEAIARGLWS
jgi:hypothetical protein